LYLNDGAISIGGESWSTNDSPFIYRNDVISVDLSNSGLVYINGTAFYGCSGLTSVNIPDSVTKIGNSTFNGCSGLTSVTIPNSLTSIGTYAFGGCSRLTSINIPDLVTEIGMWAFGGCSSLTSVTCNALIPPTLGINNFTAENDTLYVPSESVSTYQSNDKWSTAFTTITAINN
jgi:hypothetical protein